MIVYGIEIDTETNETDESIGLFGGQLRYVTGVKDYKTPVIMDKSGQCNDCSVFNSPTVDYKSITFDGIDQYADTGTNETDGSTVSYHLRFRTETITDLNNTIYDNSSATAGVSIVTDNDELTITILNVGGFKEISFTGLLNNTDYLLVINIASGIFNATLNGTYKENNFFTIDPTGTNGQIAKNVSGSNYGNFTLYNFKILKNNTPIIDIEGKNTTQYLTGDNSQINISLNGLETFATSIASGEIYAYSNGEFKIANRVPKHLQVITLLSTTDTSDSHFTTIKGSALAVGDMFEHIKESYSSTATSRYLGQSKYVINYIKSAAETDGDIDIESFGAASFNNSCRFSLNDKGNLIDTLKDLEIQLENKRVKAFMIENDVAYQYYFYKIKTVTPGQDIINVSCGDVFKEYEEIVPPNKITEGDYPNLVQTNNYDKNVPVVVGNVPKSEMLNVTQSSDGNKLIFRIDDIDTSGDYIRATLVTGSPDLILDLTKQQFLRVFEGSSTDTDKVREPNKSKLYKIVAALGNLVGGYWQYQIETEPKFDEGTITDMNTYALTIDPSSVLIESTWWAEIIDYESTHVISNNEIAGLTYLSNPKELYQWSTQQDDYIDLNGIIGDSSLTSDTTSLYPYLGTVLTNVESNGDLQTYSSGLVESASVYDRDITVIGVTNFQQLLGDPNALIRLDYDIELFNLDGSVNTVFFCPDLILDINGAVSAGIITVELTVRPKIFVNNTTGGGKEYYRSAVSKTYTYDGYPAGDSVVKLAFSPDFFFQNGGAPGTGWIDMFNSYENDLVRSAGLEFNSETLEGIVNKNYAYVTVEALVRTSTDINVNNDPNVSTLTVSNFNIMKNDTVNLLSDNLYTYVEGERNLDTTRSETVPGAFKLLMESYAGISEDIIDYDNLEIVRNNWDVGRHINDSTNTTSLIKSLAEQSFVGVTPKRLGGYRLKAWLDDEIPTYNFLEDDIVRGTFKDVRQTNTNKIYNNMLIEYGYDDGSDEYKRTYEVKNVFEETFPTETATDSNGNLLWKQWVVGFIENYEWAKSLWTNFRNSYLENQIKNELPSKNSKLLWFQDQNEVTKTYNVDIDNSAYQYALKTSTWSARKKNNNPFSLPMNSNNLKIEYLDTCTLKDKIYTNDNTRTGWIISKSIKPDDGVIEVQLLSKVEDAYPIWQDTLESELPTTHEDSIGTITHEDVVTKF